MSTCRCWVAQEWLTRCSCTMRERRTSQSCSCPGGMTCADRRTDGNAVLSQEACRHRAVLGPTRSSTPRARGAIHCVSTNPSAPSRPRRPPFEPGHGHVEPQHALHQHLALLGRRLQFRPPLRLLETTLGLDPESLDLLRRRQGREMTQYNLDGVLDESKPSRWVGQGNAQGIGILQIANAPWRRTTPSQALTEGLPVRDALPHASVPLFVSRHCPGR